MHQPAVHADADHAPLALRDGDEIDRVVARDLREYNAVDRGDLIRVRAQYRIERRPHHHRRDQVAGAGRIVVERAEDIGGAELEPDLLAQLPQRRRGGGLALVDAPARQRVLALVLAQAAGALGQHESHLAGRLLRRNERDSDRGPLESERGIARRQAGERRASARNQSSKAVVEWIEHARLILQRSVRRNASAAAAGADQGCRDAVASPRIIASPSWLTAENSQSMSRSPPSSRLPVTQAMQVSTSPGQNREAKRMRSRRNASSPSHSVSRRAQKPPASMPMPNTVLLPFAWA